MRSILWMALAFSSRVLFAFFLFYLLAPALGTSGYGAYAATVAAIALVSPFVDCGAYSLVIQKVSHGGQLQRVVGAQLSLAAFALPAGILLIGAVKFLLLTKVPWDVVLFMAAGTLVGGRLQSIGTALHAVREKFARNAAIEFSSGASKLALAFLVIGVSGDLRLWALLYGLHYILVGGLAFAWATLRENVRFPTHLSELPSIREGIAFAVGAASHSAYTDLDKALLARMATLHETGIYSAAYRVVSMAYLPVHAFFTVMYPRYFQSAAQGVAVLRALGLRTLGISLILGSSASVVLWLVAPILPVMFGDEYAEAVNAVRVLAFVPLLQSIYFPVGDVLTGLGRQAARTRLQLGSLLCNLILNFMMIPALGWRGAAYATIASEAFLAVAVCVQVYLLGAYSNSEINRA